MRTKHTRPGFGGAGGRSDCLFVLWIPDRACKRRKLSSSDIANIYYYSWCQIEHLSGHVKYAILGLEVKKQRTQGAMTSKTRSAPKTHAIPRKVTRAKAYEWMSAKHDKCIRSVPHLNSDMSSSSYALASDS